MKTKLAGAETRRRSLLPSDTTRRVCATSLAALALCAEPSWARVPETELAAFRLARGFEIQVFADEDQGVIKPIQSRFDARGRLWVVGSTVYPQLRPGEIPNDKIVVLEDVDGDGRADRSTVFAEGLFIPTGIELTGDGCLVGNSTELLRLRDTDGDGRADVREVVLRGFGTGDNHQNLNSFQWSPGGELWFSQGLHANSRVETPWGVVRLDHAGIWRLRPRRMQLDGFFGNELPPHNPWGFAFDAWGAMLVLAGNGHGIYDPLPIEFRGHAIRPLDQIWRESRGRKLCGGDFCENQHFPAAWQGTLFAGGFMNNAVYALRVAEDGATFRLDDTWFDAADVLAPARAAEASPNAPAPRQVNDATAPAPGVGNRQPFLASLNTAFRPVDVKFGPDGALYITDWSNPIIGHYQTSFRHPDRDKTHGRIWRITAMGRATVKSPPLVRVGPGGRSQTAPLEVLLEHLKSGDRFTRLQAKRLLSQAETAAVTNAVATWVARLNPADADLEHRLFEALGVYEDHEVLEPALLRRLLEARDARARVWATQTVGRWSDRLPEALALLQARVRDTHPRVRLAAVVACGTLPRPEALTLALQALGPFPGGATSGAGDRFLDYAIRQAIYVLKPHWLERFRTDPLGLAGSAEALQYLVTADGSADTIGVVRELAGRPDNPAATQEAFARALAESGTPADYARLLQPDFHRAAGGLDPARQARVLRQLEVASRARNQRPDGDVTPALRELWGTQQRDLQLAALRLATLWKAPAFASSALYAVACTPADDELRQAGALALATLDGAQAVPVLESLTVPGRALGEQVAGVLGLSSLNLTNGTRLAAAVLARDNSGQAAPQLLPALVGRTGGSALLAAAIVAQPPSRDAARLGLRWMQSVGRTDSNLVAVLSRAAQLDAEPLRATPALVSALAAEVRQEGDARRGAEIFRRADLNCLACHTVGTEGGTIGPDLNAIGSGQPLDFIMGAVLEPNKEVKENYEAIEVTTRDGETYVGYRVKTGNESEFTLRDTARNEIVRLRRDQVASVTQRGSVMPSGLVDHLTRAELRDLFRYLSELGRQGR